MGLKPEHIAGAIPVIGGLLSSGINAITQGAQNRKQREWNEKMYGIQRTHSLQDWAMQNEYNSPRAQMQRLKDAKLNPNLVYGNGADAGSASLPQQSDIKQWSPDPAKFDFGSVAQQGVNSYMAMKMQAAQIDNLKTQNDVLLQDALLKASQINLNQANTDRSKFDLAYQNEIKHISIDALKSTVDKTKAEIGKIAADTKHTTDSNTRAAQLHPAALKQAMAQVYLTQSHTRSNNQSITESKKRVEKMDVEINNLVRDGKLKDLELKMKEKGMTFSDPLVLRWIQSAMGDGAFTTEGIVNGLLKKLEAYKAGKN